MLLLSAASLWAAACGPVESPERPHIVLLSIDTLNPSSLSAYRPDAPPLPHLDAFARSAARFDRAVSTASWTLPAHASLLTGTYPDRHGATEQRRLLSEDVQTLAETLHDAGYATVAFTDGGFVSGGFGFSRGFEIYDRESSAPDVDPSILPRAGARDHGMRLDLFDRAIAYLRARPPGARPLFLFLHTYSVHDYFRLKPWAVRAAEESGATLPDLKDQPAYMLAVRSLLHCLQGDKECTEETWELLGLLYAAEVRHLDDAAGTLFDTLEETGILPNALVTILSDHGEGFDPGRDRIHHGGRLHRDVLRVPLLMAGPGISAGPVEPLVSLVDVMPTLLELAGVTVPEGLDGRSLAGLLGRPARPPDPRAVHAMEHQYRWENGRRLVATEAREEPYRTALVDEDVWLIAGESDVELYDVRDDPEQLDDLAETSPRIEELRALMALRRRSLPGSAEMTPDSALVEQLRALGYAE